MNPKKVGNSPIIRGEVISRKSGVKVDKGITRERSASLIAFKYNIAVATFKEALMHMASQKPSFISGISIKNSKGIKIGNPKKFKAHATTYSSMFFRPNLPATSVRERKKAVRNAKRIQVIELSF